MSSHTLDNETVQCPLVFQAKCVIGDSLFMVIFMAGVWRVDLEKAVVEATLSVAVMRLKKFPRHRTQKLVL